MACPTDLTLSNISHLHEETVAAFAQDGPIVFDIDTLEAVDLAFVQLVEAARKQAATRGTDIRLSRPAAEPVAQVLRRAGLLTRATSDDIDFWFHGALPQ